ncbi:MAG TPA: hypothetical protein VFC78_14605 [Tepidisphaeraceae bacterium]|nr:hypothetical protein [Tepidisphaeraceae bacterium]
MNTPAVRAIKRAFSQPAFLILVILLAACAATLNTAAARMQVFFKKQAVPLRVSSLKVGIPSKLGHWVQIGPDQSIDPEIEQVLGTSQYVFRDYVDSSKVPTADIESMNNDNTTNADRQRMLAELQARKPESVIRAAVTYYTGIVDTVAHVPERCYVADGFDVTQSEPRTVALGSDPRTGKPRNIEYRFLNFEDQTGGQNHTNRVSRNVGYVFNCDGQYMSNSYAVRQHLQNLFERYGYYAKLELMTAAPVPPRIDPNASLADVNNRADSQAAMEDFMVEALPYLEKCLPDWEALHSKASAAH